VVVFLLVCRRELEDAGDAFHLHVAIEKRCDASVRESAEGNGEVALRGAKLGGGRTAVDRDEESCALPPDTGLGLSGWFSKTTRLMSSFQVPSALARSCWKNRHGTSFTSLPPVTATRPSYFFGACLRYPKVTRNQVASSATGSAGAGERRATCDAL
jgi:hypothetical protein